MANDDYRFQVEFPDGGEADFLEDTLKDEKHLAESLRRVLGDHVIVTRDGSHVFLYAGSEADGNAAAKAVGDLISQNGLEGVVAPLQRWHTVEKQWEDASKPLPETEGEIEAEHQSWEAREAADSAEDNLAEWELRIELGSHHDAVALAKQLEQEGISPIVRRWKYLLVGAANEDTARALAERLRSELPGGAELKVEAAPVWLYEGAKRHPLRTMGGGLAQPGDQEPT
jgi:hypothetical protein